MPKSTTWRWYKIKAEDSAIRVRREVRAEVTGAPAGRGAAVQTLRSEVST